MLGPVLTIDIWLEHINPSFTALSTNSIWEVVGNTSPLLSSVLHHLLSQDLVLFKSPQGVVGEHNLWFGARRDFHGIYLLPPLEASNFRFVWHALADPVPSTLAVLLNQVAEDEVLHLCPDHLLVRHFGLPFIELVLTSIGETFSFVGEVIFIS